MSLSKVLNKLQMNSLYNVNSNLHVAWRQKIAEQKYLNTLIFIVRAFELLIVIFRKFFGHTLVDYNQQMALCMVS